MSYIVVLVLYLINLRTYLTQSTGTYWKDYDGTVPDDAVQGGTDTTGYPTYIGQFPISKLPLGQTADLVSATIIKNNTRAYGIYNSTVVYDYDAIKILCTIYPYHYRWSNTFIPNCDLIEGDTSDSQQLYIGRANYKGQNMTGSFSRDDIVLEIAWVHYPKEDVLRFSSFEMLFYCSNA